MNETISTAYISFAGILITAAVSYLTSVISARHTIKKMHGELSGKLYEKKLSVYPLIYQKISEFLKKTHETAFTHQDVTEFKNKFDETDSENAILFNAITTEEVYELRIIVNNASSLKSKDFEDWKNKNKNALSDHLQRVELALKYELGVYGFSTPTELKKSKAYVSYRQAWPFKKKIERVNQYVQLKIKILPNKKNSADAKKPRECLESISKLPRQ